MIIETKFELDEKVKIIPFDEKEGRITGFYYSACGLKYYVAYFINYECKYEYFYQDELIKA